MKEYFKIYYRSECNYCAATFLKTCLEGSNMKYRHLDAKKSCRNIESDVMIGCLQAIMKIEQ
jgi:hypothetical protein